MISSATKTVSLLPIKNMDTNLLNIFRRSVGAVHGQKHSVAFDLSATFKEKINKIKDIKTEETTELDYIYPLK